MGRRSEAPVQPTAPASRLFSVLGTSQECRPGRLALAPRHLGYGRFGAKVTMDCKLGGAQLQPSGE